MQTRRRSRRPPGRLTAVDAGRGIAIVLVVLLHSADWLEVAHLNVGFWGDFNHVVNGLRMPLFFTVSGLLGAKWSRARWPSLFSGKVTILLWAYFMWQPIGSLVGLVVNQIKGDPTEPVRMLTSLLATPVRPRLELWFLWALALSFVVARVTRRVPVPVQLGIAGTVSAVWLSNLVPPGNPGWDGWPSYYVFFLLGMHYRPLLITWTERARANRTRAKLVVACWLVIATAMFLTRVDQFPGPSIAVRLVGLAAGLSIAALLAGRPLLRYFGSHTLPIYLAHTPLIILCVRFLQLNQDAGWVGALRPVMPLLLTTLVVPLTLALHTALMRTPAKVLYNPPRWVLVRVTAFCSRFATDQDAAAPEAPRAPQPGPRLPAPAAESAPAPQFADRPFASAAPLPFAASFPADAPVPTPSPFLPQSSFQASTPLQYPSPSQAPAPFRAPGLPVTTGAGKPSPYEAPPVPMSPYLRTPVAPSSDAPATMVMSAVTTPAPATPALDPYRAADSSQALPHPAPPPPPSPYQGTPYPVSPYVVEPAPEAPSGWTPATGWTPPAAWMAVPVRAGTENRTPSHS